MNRHESRKRAAAVRAIGGERKATRAEQLRARGRGDQTIARELGVEQDAVAHWFEFQDELVLGAGIGGAA